MFITLRLLHFVMLHRLHRFHRLPSCATTVYHQHVSVPLHQCTLVLLKQKSTQFAAHSLLPPLGMDYLQVRPFTLGKRMGAVDTNSARGVVRCIYAQGYWSGRWCSGKALTTGSTEFTALGLRPVFNCLMNDGDG